ncbi:MAG: SLBB domain-containing protein, partial [Silvibacterium sp.]|nr:SLBB domain-containing protein [Silvibacterium sp.]
MKRFALLLLATSALAQLPEGLEFPSKPVLPQTLLPETLPPEVLTKPGKPVAPPTPPPPPKAAPSEFQTFVQSSTGQLLPIFGASLFDQVPSTFAPLDNVPVTADYVIGPGDEILLRVWGQVTFNRDLTVDRSGSIYIPQAGNINVAGLQFQQLNGFLHDQLSRVYRNFEMNVSMGQLRSIQIFVMGQARRPGTYTVSSLSTLVDALFASGGPTPQGSMRRIQLKRGQQIVTEFDLYDLLLHGDKSKDASLAQGDVIYMPPAGPQVAIAGSVKAPAIYELKSERTVEDLIRMACGLSAIADTQQATLERVQNHQTRRAATMPLEGPDLRASVQDGDILRILPVLPRFTNVVTLRGNVANPGRFAWHEGMKLR